METNGVDQERTVCVVVQRAIELIGKRWSGAILFVLMSGPACYSEILMRVPELRDRLLSERLKELEDAGMVTREVIPARPPAVRYTLTEKGREVGPILDAVAAWAYRWGEPAQEAESAAIG